MSKINPYASLSHKRQSPKILKVKKMIINRSSIKIEFKDFKISKHIDYKDSFYDLTSLEVRENKDYLKDLLKCDNISQKDIISIAYYGSDYIFNVKLFGKKRELKAIALNSENNQIQKYVDLKYKYNHIFLPRNIYSLYLFNALPINQDLFTIDKIDLVTKKDKLKYPKLFKFQNSYSCIVDNCNLVTHNYLRSVSIDNKKTDLVLRLGWNVYQGFLTFDNWLSAKFPKEYIKASFKGLTEHDLIYSIRKNKFEFDSKNKQYERVLERIKKDNRKNNEFKSVANK